MLEWLLGKLFHVHVAVLSPNLLPFVQLYVFPWSSPSRTHNIITRLRVQIPYTLETHGTYYLITSGLTRGEYIVYHNAGLAC